MGVALISPCSPSLESGIFDLNHRPNVRRRRNRNLENINHANTHLQPAKRNSKPVRIALDLGQRQRSTAKDAHQIAPKHGLEDIRTELLEPLTAITLG
jgi:hypothetical protein